MSWVMCGPFPAARSQRLSAAICTTVRKRAGVLRGEGYAALTVRRVGRSMCAGGVARATAGGGQGSVAAALRPTSDCPEFGQSMRRCCCIPDHASPTPRGYSHGRPRLVHSRCRRAGAGSADLNAVARFERLGQLGVVNGRHMAALRLRNALGVWS